MDKIIKYKILKEENNGEYISPFQSFNYGKLKDFIDKQMVCDNFDESNLECSNGFYVTDIDGLIYTNLSGNKVVFEVEVSGKSVIINNYKQRFEKQKFIRKIPLNEVKEMVKEESKKMDWNYYDMLFPKNPLTIKNKQITNKEINLLKEWDSVCDSVRDSVRDSVGDSVRDSVGAFVWAFISFGFPNIKKWEYIGHEKGKNPFQPVIDLWNSGLVAGFDGEIWRLHSGEKAEIVFEISKEDLVKYKN